MTNLDFYKNGIYMQFCIDDDGRITVTHIGRAKSNLEQNWEEHFVFQFQNAQQL